MSSSSRIRASCLGATRCLFGPGRGITPARTEEPPLARGAKFTPIEGAATRPGKFVQTNGIDIYDESHGGGKPQSPFSKPQVFTQVVLDFLLRQSPAARLLPFLLTMRNRDMTPKWHTN